MKFLNRKDKASQKAPPRSRSRVLVPLILAAALIAAVLGAVPTAPSADLDQVATSSSVVDQPSETEAIGADGGFGSDFTVTKNAPAFSARLQVANVIADNSEYDLPWHGSLLMRRSYHGSDNGIDFAGAATVPIVAAGDGAVFKDDCMETSYTDGKLYLDSHGKRFKYLHLDMGNLPTAIADLAKGSSVEVKKGDLLGYMYTKTYETVYFQSDSTLDYEYPRDGLRYGIDTCGAGSTGPHLHLTVQNLSAAGAASHTKNLKIDGLDFRSGKHTSGLWYESDQSEPTTIGSSSGGSMYFATNEGSNGTKMFEATLGGTSDVAEVWHGPNRNSGTERIDHGDFDGDGDTDVLFLSKTSWYSRLLVLKNDGSGDFSSISSWYTLGNFGYNGTKFMVGDINADGKDDVVIATNDSSWNGGVGIFAYTSTGSGFSHAPGFTTRYHDLKWSETHFDMGDVDALGVADDIVMLTKKPDGTAKLMVAQSTYESFVPLQEWRNLSGFGWAGLKMVVGNVDGEVRDDVVLLTSEASGFRAFVYEGHGNPWFINSGQWLNNTTFGWHGIKPMLSDLDGDGKDDLVVVTDNGPGQVGVYSFSSEGSNFTAAHDYEWSYSGFGWSGVTPIFMD